MFANIAWNECVGMGGAREGYRKSWEAIERENPAMWREFKSTDVAAMLDGLVRYKKKRFRRDQRRILVCGVVNGNIRVEWLPPVAPGVDTNWEMTLYGTVRTGNRDEVVEFLRRTRQMTRAEAVKQVKKIASDLGMD